MANFEKRPRGQAIFFIGNRKISQPGVVNEGDYVTLRIRINASHAESVLVKDVHIIDASHFSGEVYGFEPSYASECQGIKVGDEEKFEEEHIFSCDTDLKTRPI